MKRPLYQEARSLKHPHWHPIKRRAQSNSTLACSCWLFLPAKESVSWAATIRIATGKTFWNDRRHADGAKSSRSSRELLGRPSRKWLGPEAGHPGARHQTGNLLSLAGSQSPPKPPGSRRKRDQPPGQGQHKRRHQWKKRPAAAQSSQQQNSLLTANRLFY